MDKYSLSDIKKKNRLDIFRYIYKNNNSSKQKIATAQGISLPTVSQHLSDLINDGLIKKCGQLSSNIGRKATAYSVISTAKISVGIEILKNFIYIVAIDLYGKVIAKSKIAIEFNTNEQYFSNLKDQINIFFEKNHYEESQILGVGLGVQGLTSQDGNVITYGKVLDCENLSIFNFQKYFSFPCKFFHDAECAANSELWENSEIKDCIYISLGYHLGGAIILNRIFQKGLTGKSGTFEHMTLVPNGIDCYCGKNGCAECYCSANALSINNQAELDDFFVRKSQEDAECIQQWNDYLNYLSLLINNLHMVLENTVILGGHITPYFTDDDILNIHKNVFELSTFKDPTSYILIEKNINDPVSIGSALPFITEYLNCIETTNFQVL